MDKDTKLPNGLKFPGLLPDTRTPAEKAKDYRYEEVASATAPKVTWIAKQPDQWKSYPIYNQDGSSSCVAFATAKVLGIEQTLDGKAFLNFSKRFIYSQRVNKPGEGMIFTNALDIVRLFGDCPEGMMPGENVGEGSMNFCDDRSLEIEQMALAFKEIGYAQIPYDIDTIAGIMASKPGKPILIGLSFNYDEWTDVPTIRTNNPQLRHAIAAVDYCLWNGKKALIIEDSWGPTYGLQGRRVITEDFLERRLIFAGYFLDLSKDPQQVPKPQHTFNKVLKLNVRKSVDVVALQNVLKYEGFFPYKQNSSGNYFELTRKGVLAFMRKYKVATEAEIVNNNGEQVGPKTLAKLNELYS